MGGKNSCIKPGNMEQVVGNSDDDNKCFAHSTKIDSIGNLSFKVNDLTIEGKIDKNGQVSWGEKGSENEFLGVIENDGKIRGSTK